MGLRDVLKKKDHLEHGDTSSQDAVNRLAAPEFTFIRSDTHSQEVIHPPSAPTGESKDQLLNPKESPGDQKPRRSLDIFFGSRSRSVSASSQTSTTPTRKIGRRLSERLHLGRSPASSDNVPQNLPDIISTAEGEQDELQWEKRATILASANKSRPETPAGDEESGNTTRGRSLSAAVSSPATDQDIQEAIRLHEAGQSCHDLHPVYYPRCRVAFSSPRRGSLCRLKSLDYRKSPPRPSRAVGE